LSRADGGWAAGDDLVLDLEQLLREDEPEITERLRNYDRKAFARGNRSRGTSALQRKYEHFQSSESPIHLSILEQPGQVVDAALNRLDFIEITEKATALVRARTPINIVVTIVAG
jgi:hypothetical protein